MVMEASQKSKIPNQPSIDLGLRFLIASDHECNYLANRNAMMLYLDPYAPQSPLTYSFLIEKGFRRSGEYVYRPHCAECVECLPVRIAAHHFNPSHNLRRVMARNRDLTVRILPPYFHEEHFQLYSAYLGSRHQGGLMDNPTRDSYLEFIGSSWMSTALYEFRQQEQLLMVAVVDHLDDALSAVYTFYHPSESRRSLGTYAIIWQVNETLILNKQWLYLGYWIASCQKMNYKSRFPALQMLQHGQWVAFQPK